MGQRRFRRLRWVAMALLTLWLTVQGSSYGALADRSAAAAMPAAGWVGHTDTVGATATPVAPTVERLFAFDESQLLAQLHPLPQGSLALPQFDPRVNGFQFSNQELIEAIDLQRHGANWETVMTAQLQRLFGNQVCLGQAAQGCVLTSAARDWLRTQLGRMNLGLSDGMAAAALSLWQPRPQRLPWWQRLVNGLLGRTVFGLARNLFELQTYIANLFLMQSVPEVAQQTQAIRDSRTPTQILLAMLNSFLGGARDPVTLGVYRLLEGALIEGHALTPYRIEDRGRGRYWVYIYDSNYPAGRSTSPANLHVEFDTVADTWRYQPTAQAPVFQGDASSHTLDLTQLSWRQPQLPETPGLTGPFTCPFCQGEAVAAVPSESPTPVTPSPTPSVATPATPLPPTVDITLRGEGRLTVRPYGGNPVALTSVDGVESVALAPFRGGLNREVPASYHLPPESLDQPWEIVLTGTETAPAQPATLQMTGPGYTANFENLALTPDEDLTLYLVPTPTGPELTFLAHRAMAIPKLSIHLSDNTSAYAFDSSTAEGDSHTERRVSRSAGFEINGLQLTAGHRVALIAKGDLKRLYFADDDGRDSQYSLTVKNRMVIRDRIEIGQTQPDILTYTLTYEEELRVRNLLVDANAQAFFDYDPAFIDPGTLPRQELLTALDQRTIPLAIAYEPLSADPNRSGPLSLRPAKGDPIGKRVFQASLHHSDL